MSERLDRSGSQIERVNPLKKAVLEYLRFAYDLTLNRIFGDKDYASLKPFIERMKPGLALLMEQRLTHFLNGDSGSMDYINDFGVHYLFGNEERGVWRNEVPGTWDPLRCVLSVSTDMDGLVTFSYNEDVLAEPENMDRFRKVVLPSLIAEQELIALSAVLGVRDRGSLSVFLSEMSDYIVLREAFGGLSSRREFKKEDVFQRKFDRNDVPGSLDAILKHEPILFGYAAALHDLAIEKGVFKTGATSLKDFFQSQGELFGIGHVPLALSPRFNCGEMAEVIFGMLQWAYLEMMEIFKEIGIVGNTVINAVAYDLIRTSERIADILGALRKTLRDLLRDILAKTGSKDDDQRLAIAGLLRRVFPAMDLFIGSSQEILKADLSDESVMGELLGHRKQTLASLEAIMNRARACDERKAEDPITFISEISPQLMAIVEDSGEVGG